MLCQLLENRRYLHRSFSFSENHLWHSDPQSAVMVHLRKAQVLKRKMAQLLDRVVGRDLAGADLLEKLANGFGVQRKAQYKKVA